MGEGRGCNPIQTRHHVKGPDTPHRSSQVSVGHCLSLPRLLQLLQGSNDSHLYIPPPLPPGKYPRWLSCAELRKNNLPIRGSCALQKLTALQTARCFVRSFPFYPDIPAIAAWVALSQGDNLALSIESTLRSTEDASPTSSS